MGINVDKNQKPVLSNKVVIGAAAVVVAAVVGVGAFVATREPAESAAPAPAIGYATDAKVMLDETSLQAAFDEAMKNAAEGNVGLKYQNDAYSKNGTDFKCYIANSESNVYDMFLTIFADQELTDRLFLSGLVPPGSGFENITLEHVLEKGDHTVYVVLTQVDTSEETGEQVIKNQITHTMDLHVTG